MHECERCGFKTSRLDSFKRHLNRKNPCKNNKGVVSNEEIVDSYVVPNGDLVVPGVIPDDLSKQNIQKKIYNCEICGLSFANRQNRYRHVKRGVCKTPSEVCQPIVEASDQVEVCADGKERLFPFDQFLEVVLQKAAEVCESYIRQHYNEGALKDADVLEALACNLRKEDEEENGN